ncbi:hypothetical protein BH23ACT2_BH23ACT2_20600 [soil metagenome]
MIPYRALDDGSSSSSAMVQAKIVPGRVAAHGLAYR